MAPGIPASPLTDDPRGRALDTLSAVGVTERYSLMASTAATRWGRTPTVTPLDTTRVQGAGRSNSAAVPAAQVVPMPQGSSREPRPALNPVRWALCVAPQAGIALLRKPLRGKRRDGKGCGQVVSDPMAQLPTPSSPTDLVADSARSHAKKRHKLADTRLTWLTRVPATLPEAQEVFAQAQPVPLASLPDGYRAALVAASDGGGAQRGGLCDSDHRQPQAQRPVDPQGRTQRADAGKACKTLGRTAFACAAEARQARTRVGAGGHTTLLPHRPIGLTPPYGQRGRPGPGAPSPPRSSPRWAGPWRLGARPVGPASPRSAVVAWRRTPWPRSRDPPRQGSPALKDQPGQTVDCASSQPHNFWPPLFLKKPERMMALLMVLTGWGLVSAAVEDRLRTVLKDNEATLPDQKGNRLQRPTARGVCHSFVGMHVLRLPGPPYIVLNLVSLSDSSRSPRRPCQREKRS